jgi:prevent-host-death family protein
MVATAFFIPLTDRLANEGQELALSGHLIYPSAGVLVAQAKGRARQQRRQPFLATAAARDNLVSMTRIRKANPPHPPGRWPLQDAKARFSELVRRARSEGPQHVTVHGRDEVVVVAADEFRRLKGDRTGEALIAAMQASPYRDIDIEPRREPMPVRDVKL